MKKIIFVLTGVCLFAVNLYATDVPVAVKNAFAKKFPGARDVKWGRENAREYEADFTVGKTAMSANFDSRGKWLETETTIRPDELPESVFDAVKHRYPKFNVAGAAKIETQKSVRYEAELQPLKGKIIEKEFSVDGKPLN